MPQKKAKPTRKIPLKEGKKVPKPRSERKKNNPNWPKKPPYFEGSRDDLIKERAALGKEKIMDLRLKGYNTPQIAVLVGLDEATVSMHIRNAIDLAAANYREAGEQLRELELQRLDMIQSRVFSATFLRMEVPNNEGKMEPVLDEDGQPRYLVSHHQLGHLLRIVEMRTRLSGIADPKGGGEDDTDTKAQRIADMIKKAITSTSGGRMEIPPEPMKGSEDEDDQPKGEEG